MDIRKPVKHLLRMCGHAIVSTVHERLDNIDRQLAHILEQNAQLAKNQTALQQSSIKVAHSLSSIESALPRMDTGLASPVHDPCVADAADDERRLAAGAEGIGHRLDDAASVTQAPSEATESQGPRFDNATEPTSNHGSRSAAPQDADAIVTPFEVNDQHGVGVLLARLFSQNDNIVSIHSMDLYEGRQTFGAMHACISHGNTSRDSVNVKVLEALRGATVKRVLCIPYLPDDVLSAIALKETFGVPLCTFLMDDQNLSTDGIPDSLMRELLAKSALRLAISPELYEGYGKKYGYKMSFMPPLVSLRFILPRINQLPDTALQSKSAVIIGNIWGQRWLELLRQTVRDSGVTLRWYNNGEFRWLSCTKEALAGDGILLQDGPRDPDHRMVEVLRQSAFVVVPSGVLDDTDDRRFIAQLSLPSRIPYILATSQAPLLVMGNPETAAARFVTANGLGLVAPYERQAFLDAVEQISRPDVNLEMRRAALLLASRFADVGGEEWLWQSLARGEPVDCRYEEMLPRQMPDMSRFVAPRPG